MHSSPIDTIYYYMGQYWQDIQDPRTAHYPLANVSFWTMTNIMAIYYLLVKKIGPELMKNREPFQLRKPMLVYNISMIAINFFFFCTIVARCDYGRRFLDFKYPDRNDTSPRALNEIHLGYFYWLSKFADWLDTTFMVLRKKQSHVSFLHVYHHISVPAMGFLFMKLNPLVPAVGLFGLINSFIHTVMYSYYALSSLGPSVQKYLWWKKYITKLQLAQFVIGTLYGCLMVVFQTGYPQVILWFGMTQPPLFFYMFYNFYKQTYKKRSVDIIKKEAIENNNNECVDKSQAKLIKAQ